MNDALSSQLDGLVQVNEKGESGMCEVLMHWLGDSGYSRGSG